MLFRSYDREKLVSLFAEENVMFEFPVQKECIEIINDVIEHNLVKEEGIKRLEALYDYVEDEDIQNLIIEIKATPAHALYSPLRLLQFFRLKCRITFIMITVVNAFHV